MPYPRCRTTATPRSLCKHATELSGSTASLRYLAHNREVSRRGVLTTLRGAGNCKMEEMGPNGSEGVAINSPPPSFSKVRHSLWAEIGENDIGTEGLTLIGEGRLSVHGQRSECTTYLLGRLNNKRRRWGQLQVQELSSMF